MLRQIERFSFFNDGLGVDRMDSLFHDIYFIHADGFEGGDELTVDVAKGYGVVIDQYEMADSASGKGFAAIAAHPS